LRLWLSAEGGLGAGVGIREADFCPPPQAAGRKKLKTTAQAQKILRGRGGKKIFCALAF